MSAQTSLAHDLPHDLTDITICNSDDPFFTHAETLSLPAGQSSSVDPEQALVDSLERAMLAIVSTGALLLIAALLGNGARHNIFAHDGAILCGAAALLSATVAIFSTIQSVARLLDLFRPNATDDVLACPSSWDPP